MCSSSLAGTFGVPDGGALNAQAPKVVKNGLWRMDMKENVAEADK
jgi:hypothetical protein